MKSSQKFSVRACVLDHCLNVCCPHYYAKKQPKKLFFSPLLCISVKCRLTKKWHDTLPPASGKLCGWMGRFIWQTWMLMHFAWTLLVKLNSVRAYYWQKVGLLLFPANWSALAMFLKASAHKNHTSVFSKSLIFPSSLQYKTGIFKCIGFGEPKHRGKKCLPQLLPQPWHMVPRYMMR